MIVKINLGRKMNINKQDILTEKEQYPRTDHDFSLDEICYVMDRLSRGVSVEEIAEYIQRAPWLVSFKFIEYRPINPDGTYDYSRSVETPEEALTYQKQQYKETVTISKEEYYERTGQIFQEDDLELF